MARRTVPPPYLKGGPLDNWNTPGIYKTKSAPCRCGAVVRVLADVYEVVRCPYCRMRDVDFTEVSAE